MKALTPSLQVQRKKRHGRNHAVSNRSAAPPPSANCWMPPSIPANAKVSRGAVQHHFGSRDSLLAAVVSDLGQSLTVSNPIENDLPLLRRLDAAIDRDWEIFSNPQFLAVIQIWMAERGNAKLFPDIQRMVRDVETDLDKQWAEALEDSELSEREIVALRHVVLSSLRGLALRTVSIGRNATWEKELEMLKRMVRQLLIDPGQ